MVLRIHIHKICISLGVIICIFSVLNIIKVQSTEVSLAHKPQLPTLILDPGHGGEDGGAVAIDGTKESLINLDIALKINELALLCGIPTVMTRSTEEIPYPPDAVSIAQKKIADQYARLRLIQDYPHGILISIHQNTYPHESVNGVQVLYGHNEESKLLGTILQEQMNEIPEVQRKRSAAEISDDIYLLKHCECIAVLVECGFISNHKECKLLQSMDYQKKLTAVILGTYMEQYSK